MFGRRSPSALLALVVALLAVVAVGCGVESTDDADASATTEADGGASSTTDDSTDSTDSSAVDDTTSTTDDDDDTTTTEDDSTDTTSGSSVDVPAGVRNQLIDTYIGIGFTEDQATCLADEILDSGVTGGTPDFSQADAFEWIEACGISLSDLSKIGAG